ncbi:hypothetical protein V4U86_03555 [Mycobacterium sp. AMU20-3851]|uniref:hypothetical protein n=1 Tax=Mycobacterium sp. AMU20-3851 TaxID=3122055 RepID=UPI0037551E92
MISHLKNWRWWVVIPAVVGLVGCSGNSTDVAGQAAPPPPDIPHTTLLASPMRQQPVPGWRLDIAQLALPADAGVLPLANIGERGIFLGVTEKDWWLAGLNVGNGEPFMDARPIGSAANSDIRCAVNKPPNVLCIRSGPGPDGPSEAFVVATDSGEVTFQGPTEVRAASTDRPQLEQVGEYAIATVRGKGVHGIGSRGELTWFVPGDGSLPTQFTEPAQDTEPPNLASQGSGGIADLVFSVTDGTVVKPALPQDVQLGRAMVYPGGFGYEFTPKDDFTSDRIAFFDEVGRLLSEPDHRGTLESGSLGVPTVLTPRQEIVMAIDGRQLLELPRTLPSSASRLIGSRLFVSRNSDTTWEQYDLIDGVAGKTCTGAHLGTDYLGSDGEVAVAMGESSVAQGVDLSSCETLWTLPQRAQEVVRVWKVHDQLIQRAGHELSSLVAPS